MYDVWPQMWELHTCEKNYKTQVLTNTPTLKLKWHLTLEDAYYFFLWRILCSLRNMEIKHMCPISRLQHNQTYVKTNAKKGISKKKKVQKGNEEPPWLRERQVFGPYSSLDNTCTTNTRRSFKSVKFVPSIEDMVDTSYQKHDY